jgi:hypothetical protein
MKALNPFQKRSNRRLTLFLLGVGCLILLSGCTSYQYVYIDSNLKKNEIKEFVQETDSFKIKYNFSGQNFATKITIENKLNKPVYIDWGKTTLIINDIQEDGSFYSDDQINAIAPNSSVTVSSNVLVNQFIDPTPFDSTNSVSPVKDTGNIHLYNENNTPIYFRSILSLTTHEDLSSPVFFDNPFWISEIFQTTNGPSSRNIQSDQFYISKSTGFGKFMGWTLAVSVAVVAISLDGGSQPIDGSNP